MKLEEQGGDRGRELGDMEEVNPEPAVSAIEWLVFGSSLKLRKHRTFHSTPGSVAKR